MRKDYYFRSVASGYHVDGIIVPSPFFRKETFAALSIPLETSAEQCVISPPWSGIFRARFARLVRHVCTNYLITYIQPRSNIFFQPKVQFKHWSAFGDGFVEFWGLVRLLFLQIYIDSIFFLRRRMSALSLFNFFSFLLILQTTFRSADEWVTHNANKHINIHSVKSYHFYGYLSLVVSNHLAFHFRAMLLLLHSIYHSVHLKIQLSATNSCLRTRADCLMLWKIKQAFRRTVQPLRISNRLRNQL